MELVQSLEVSGWGKGAGIADVPHVQEEAEDCALGRLRVARDQAREDDDHRNALAETPTNEELAPADLFNEEPGECGKNRVADHVDAADEQSEVVRLAD